MRQGVMGNDLCDYSVHDSRLNKRYPSEASTAYYSLHPHVECFVVDHEQRVTGTISAKTTIR